MSNSFFRFKQFTIHQGSCAMKVSTDACIQGAWTPVTDSITNVLDIGGGTGLLSLMLAQRLPAAMIDAVELNEAAAEEARANAAASPFADRIQVIQADAAQWEAHTQYHLIICNPPFYKAALTGPDAARNAARHVNALDNGALIRLASGLLTPKGRASFLWPKKEHEVFCAQAEVEGLHLQNQLCIRHRMTSQVSRVIGIFGKEKPKSSGQEMLVIKDHEQYTPHFTQLLAPFYLNL